MDLFDYQQDSTPSNSIRPLADRMRPITLTDFVGQQHIIGQNSLLSRAIRADKLGSCIFYGPAGTGKTSLASIIANSSQAIFEKLNAVSSGISEAKAVIDRAKENKKLYAKRTYLILDECHRWNKAQSDSVLAAIEDGTIVFIGCTTENPYYAMTRAIISRCRIFELVALQEQDILLGLRRALQDPKGFANLSILIDDKALNHIAWAAGGDLRSAYNALELAVLTTPSDEQGQISIDLETATQSIQKKALSIDETIFYDMCSAFCKSLRGSDPDAALFWAFRMIDAGCDPLIIYRRLIVHSSEDVGIADSNAFILATNSMLAYQQIGMPEGRIILAHAIIYVATTKKSNSVINAIDQVTQDIKDFANATVPYHIGDRSYPKPLDDHSQYIYPHTHPSGAINQQYLPNELVGKKYFVYKETPKKNNFE